MASVNFEKLKSASEVKAMLRHCDTNERMKHEHENKHIDKSMTRSNLQLNRNYDDTCKLYDDRIAFLDAQNGANKRKDRVTCFGLEIPLPERLNASDAKKWVNDVYGIICDSYGDENVLQLYYHADEQHDYIDTVTNEHKQSRNHIHVYVIPEVNGKLNGKVFSSRTNMIKLNNDIEDMTQSKYGCYFMDGTKRKSKADMKSLKHKSEALQKQEDEMRAELQAEYDSKVAYLDKEIARERNSIMLARAEIERERKAIEHDRNEVDKGIEWLKGETLALRDERDALDDEKRAFQKRVDNYDNEFEKRVKEGVEKRVSRRNGTGLRADAQVRPQYYQGNDYTL